jgi:hypothetical protein
VRKIPKMASRHVPALRIGQFAAYNALGEMSRKAHIAIGIEAIVDYKTEPTIEFNFPGGTVADLFNMFASQAPQYRWSEENRIIHVYENSRPQISAIPISFPGASKTRREIWEDLAATPEVNAWLVSNNCSRGEIFGGWEFKDSNGPISIKAGTMTLAHLLDEVAIKSGDNYWAILMSSQSPPEKPCQISILLW